MQSRTLILTSLLLPALALAQALPPDEFFHSGAQWYLSNKVAEARSQVDAGLRLYPDDIKLKKLDELLKQQPQQDQKDQQQQDQQKQDQKDKQDQEKQDQQKQDQQKQDQKDQQQDQKDQKSKQDEKNDQQKKQQDQKKKDDEKKQPDEPKDGQAGEQQENPADAQPGMISPQQARQILDAQKTDEKMLPVDIQKLPPPRGDRPFKDW
jgi:Ca-activated chloride channel homolog